MIEWAANALSFSNIVFAGLLAILCFVQAKRHQRGFMRVLMILFGLIGMYWSVLYVWILLAPIGIVDPVWFGQVFVRPAFTFTLALMASMAMYRWRGMR